MKNDVLAGIFPKENETTSDLFFFAGPCVVENEKTTMETANGLAKIRDKYKINICFKSSIKKANRQSIKSFTGLETNQALSILKKVKSEFSFSILTDVHEYTNLDQVCEVADVLQTPAFLCRQTEFLERVARMNKPTNIKKGQFLSSQEMLSVVEKFKSFGNNKVLICERGTFFGYNYLVNDFRAIQELMKSPDPVVFDATHSVQRPGALGTSSGGDSQYAPGLARAAVALGVDGIFFETHPNPSVALSDGPNMIALEKMDKIVSELLAIRSAIKQC